MNFNVKILHGTHRIIDVLPLTEHWSPSILASHDFGLWLTLTLTLTMTFITSSAAQISKTMSPLNLSPTRAQPMQSGIC